MVELICKHFICFVSPDFFLLHFTEQGIIQVAGTVGLRKINSELNKTSLRAGESGQATPEYDCTHLDYVM